MNEYLEVKEHTKLKKYTILRKYIDVCIVFFRKYRNFCYVDTHGGTGRVKYKGLLEEGSPLIAAKAAEGFPCYVVEIDDVRFELLQKSIQGLDNVQLIHEDCNEVIDTVLNQIPKGKVFVCCFLDPSGLVYEGKYMGKTVKRPQLTWESIKKIGEFPRTEVLINFPLETIKRFAGYFHKRPDDPASKEYDKHLTTFFGTEEWKGERTLNKRRLLEIYRRRLRPYWKYGGAILIRSVEKNLPLYYLVFGTTNRTATKIMHGIMRKEFYGSTKPFIEQPIEDFVFED